jgi:hypothetical protein
MSTERILYECDPITIYITRYKVRNSLQQDTHLERRIRHGLLGLLHHKTHDNDGDSLRLCRWV